MKKPRKLAQFLVGLFLALPLLALLDRALVSYFGRSYWSLPRELGFFIGWPVISLLLAYALKRSRFGDFGRGLAASGVLVFIAIAIYFGLYATGAAFS